MGRGVKIAVAVIIGLIVVAVGYFAIGRPIQVLPRIQTTIPFEMSDQNGDLYRYPDRARPMNLYVVVATWDDEAVARAEEMLERVYAELREQENIDELLEIAWISPDPANDDIESLRAASARIPILQATGAPLLTAAPTVVRLAVGAGMGIYVSPPAEGQTRVAYEPGLVLVDNVGYVRGRYSLNEADERRLVRDLPLLVAEVTAEGSEKALYEAAHLFLCYPR